MTKRKEDMARVAEALGLELQPGETTSELAKRCEERAAELVELVEANHREHEQAERLEAPPPKGSAESRRAARERAPADGEAPTERAPRVRSERKRSRKGSAASQAS